MIDNFQDIIKNEDLMTHAKHGFLDDKQLYIFEEQVTGQNKSEFLFANKLNNYIYSIYELIDGQPRPSGYISDYVIASFVMMHRSYQSVIILLKKGLRSDALIILRTILEKLIHIKCIEKDNIYFDLLCIKALEDKRRIIRKIREGTIDAGELDISVIEQAVDSKVEIIIKNIEPVLGKKLHNMFSIKNLAKVAEMEQEYNSMYGVLNGYVHPDMDKMQSEFLTDDGFEYDLNPSNKDIGEHVQHLVDLLIRASAIVLTHFNLDKENLNKLFLEEISIWGKAKD